MHGCLGAIICLISLSSTSEVLSSENTSYIDDAEVRVEKVKFDYYRNDNATYSFYTEVSGKPQQSYWIIVKDYLGNYYPQLGARRQTNAKGKVKVRLVIGNVSSYPLKIFALNVTNVDSNLVHRDTLLSSSRTAVPLSNDLSNNWVKVFGLDKHDNKCSFDLVEDPSIEGVDKRKPISTNCMTQ